MLPFLNSDQAQALSSAVQLCCCPPHHFASHRALLCLLQAANTRTSSTWQTLANRASKPCSIPLTSSLKLSNQISIFLVLLSLCALLCYSLTLLFTLYVFTCSNILLQIALVFVVGAAGGGGLVLIACIKMLCCLLCLPGMLVLGCFLLDLLFVVVDWLLVVVVD